MTRTGNKDKVMAYVNRKDRRQETAVAPSSKAGTFLQLLLTTSAFLIATMIIFHCVIF